MGSTDSSSLQQTGGLDVPKTELPVVYVVDASVSVTGAFICVRNAAEIMQKHCRTVLVLPENSQIAETELAPFWRVEYLPMALLSKRFSAIVNFLPRLFKNAVILNRMLKKDQARCLQLNDFYLLHGMALRLLGSRIRVLSWVRADPRHFMGRLSSIFLSYVFYSADEMVVVSEFIGKKLPKSYKRTMLYDPYVGKGAREARLWQPDDPKRLVYIGNYISGKGQDMALEAFAIAAEEDSSLSLHFYGSDMGLEKNHAYLMELKQRTRALGLEDRVTFHGFAKDTRSLLEDAFAALNFSRSESFSMTVLEASGCGVPVIATACGGPEEILQDEKTGYLISIGNVDGAAEHIMKLANDPKLAAQMGKAGAKYVERTFTPKHFKAEMLRLYRL